MIDRTVLLPRRKYVRDARLILVAVEGAVTEPWYFHGLEAEGWIPATRIRVEVLAPADGGSSPRHSIERLRGWIREHRLTTWDRVWLVADVDRWRSGLQDALATASAEGWSFAVSNPCFEVWLQLHLAERADGRTSEEAKAAWGAQRARRGPGWPFVRTDVEAACRRAATHPDIAAWIPHPAPSTTVHRLVAELLGSVSPV